MSAIFSKRLEKNHDTQSNWFWDSTWSLLIPGLVIWKMPYWVFSLILYLVGSAVHSSLSNSKILSLKKGTKDNTGSYSRQHSIFVISSKFWDFEPRIRWLFYLHHHDHGLTMMRTISICFPLESTSSGKWPKPAHTPHTRCCGHIWANSLWASCHNWSLSAQKQTILFASCRNYLSASLMKIINFNNLNIIIPHINNSKSSLLYFIIIN